MYRPGFNCGRVALSMVMLWVTLSLGVSAASANPVMQLQNVVFADGGSVGGSFGLNVYGYVSGFSVTTTTGTTLAGRTYISAGVVGTPPSSTFTFNTASSAFALVLNVASPLGYTSSGFDAITPGSKTGSVLSGSYEECVSNQTVCGVPFGTARLITSGTVYASEPATWSLLAVAAILLPISRRLRTVQGKAPRDAA